MNKLLASLKIPPIVAKDQRRYIESDQCGGTFRQWRDEAARCWRWDCAKCGQEVVAVSDACARTTPRFQRIFVESLLSRHRCEDKVVASRIVEPLLLEYRP